MSLPGSRPRVGISSCLLGEEVRYDGRHKRDGFLVEDFGRHVEWVPVCPEVELGLGVPRPAMRLVRLGGESRLVVGASGEDLTAAMRAYAARRVEEVAGMGLCGYVFKSGSPSCGVEGVPLHGADGAPAGAGRGLFAAALRDRLPELPVEEETGLADPARRAAFAARVFALHARIAPHS